MRKLSLVFILVVLLLTGCSSKDTSDKATPTDAKIIASNSDAESIIFSDNSRVIYDSNLDIPLVYENKQVGYFHINFVERLGIWDLNNYPANQNGVYFSYAINCYVNLETYLQDHEMINVTMSPELLNSKNKVIGSAGYVGWSGYNDSIEMYDDRMDGNLEIVLQPQTTVEDEYSFLRFHVADAAGKVQFDDVYVDLSCLRNASAGASIKTINDIAEIQSINGAVYNLSFHDVYLESHEISNYEKIERGSHSFYDFQYDVNYVSAPTNDTTVLTFDAFNNNAMVGSPIMEVYSDQDGTKLYDEYDVERLLYSDSSKTGSYIVRFPLALNCGETATVSTNRLIPSSTKDRPTYVRIVVKFPAEIKARSFEEVRAFSGRYLVYQIPLGVRVLQEEPR